MRSRLIEHLFAGSVYYSKVISPVFVKLAAQYQQVQFLKVDVDAVPAIAAQFKVTAMPTFCMLRGASKLDEVCFYPCIVASMHALIMVARQMKGANPAG